MRTAYDRWTQFESFPQFMDGVESITQLDDKRNHWITKVGGTTREFDTEITEQHPNERVAWRSEGGDVKHAGVVTFHRLDDAETRVMIQIDWEPEGIAEKAGSAVNADERQVRADAKRFKHFIESGSPAARERLHDLVAPGPVGPGPPDHPSPYRCRVAGRTSRRMEGLRGATDS